MSPQLSGAKDLAAGAVLAVDGDVDAIGALITQFFTAQGWEVHAPYPGRLEVERGSRRRTVLRGGLAGAGAHLHASLELRALPGAVEVRHRWGAEAGRALGGSTGRARAVRTHQEASAALARHLAADGRAVRARPF